MGKLPVFALQHFLHTSFARYAGLPRINEVSHRVAAVQHIGFPERKIFLRL